MQSLGVNMCVFKECRKNWCFVSDNMSGINSVNQQMSKLELTARSSLQKVVRISRYNSEI